MSELIEVPKWFDEIYKEVSEINAREYIGYNPQERTKTILIQAIAHHGFGDFWTDSLIKQIGMSSHKLLNMINYRKGDKFDYITDHRLDLINGIINGYKVKEDSYIVVSAKDYESTKWSVEETTLTYSSNISKVRHLYYEDDNQLERYKDFDSSLLTSGLVFGKFKPELIKQIQEIEPKLFMNEETAEKLFNAYRVIIPINI